MTDLDPTDAWFMSGSLEVNPFHHKWTHDEATDAVTIGKHHKDRNNGHAYWIDGGWRISDVDHRAVDDLHIIKQILDALKQRNEHSQDGESFDFDFDQLHYGQPLIKIEEESNGIN